MNFGPRTVTGQCSWRFLDSLRVLFGPQWEGDYRILFLPALVDPCEVAA